MIARIIPIKRLPLKFYYFDYLIPDRFEGNIDVGQLVSIPFRNKIEFGLILSLHKNSQTKCEKIKPVESILIKQPLLSPAQINFLTEIAEFYHTPIGFLLKTCLLPLQKRKIKLISESIAVLPKKQPPQARKPKLINCTARNDCASYIFDNLDKSSQNLILVPELYQIDQLAVCLNDSRIDVFSRDTSDKKYFDLWLRVRSGEAITIIGTRRALFLPWSNLTNIFIDDEGNPNYKSWDMAPRIHARDAAFILCKHTGARLHLLSQAPSVESYYFAQKKVYDQNGKVSALQNKNIELIDMASERRGGNYSLLSDDLLEQIKSANNDVLLFINRIGSAKLVACRDCGHIFKCNKCCRPFTYFSEKKLLSCNFCKDEQTLPSSCPDCRGLNFRFFNQGVEGVAADLRKKIADENILLVDKISPRDIASLKRNEKKVIIATEFVWPHLNWNNLSVFAFVDPDAAFYTPEYKAAEELWQFLRKAQCSLLPDARLIIQTRRPDHPVFAGLIKPTIFYNFELETRLFFGYPPFNYLTRAYFGHENRAAAIAAANNALLNIRNLTKGDNNVKISNPIMSFPEFAKGKFWQIILMKLPYSGYKRAAKKIFSVLPEEWKVDPNPNNILGIL